MELNIGMERIINGHHVIDQRKYIALKFSNAIYFKILKKSASEANLFRTSFQIFYLRYY